MSVVSETVGRSGSRAGGPSGCGALCMQLAHLLVEVAKEIVGHFPRRGIDQARADLRELAADARLDVVGELGRFTLRRQAHLRAALGESRGTALAFECDRVRVRRLDVR